MKQPIGEGVGLEPSHSRGRIFASVGQQVMPLEDLMQHDPVDKAAQAETEKKTGPSGGR